MAIDFGTNLVARWPSARAEHVTLLKKAGVQAVLTDAPDAEFEKAARAAGIEYALESAAAIPGSFGDGLWPGVRSQGRRGDADLAGASREPWVDANGWRYAVERALHPERAPVGTFAHRDKSQIVPYSTLETALIEARVDGGNFVLDLEPGYREALLSGDAKAAAAWESLGKTAAWLSANRALFAYPADPTITALAADGFSEELVNLLFRRNASPAVAPASAPPEPAPEKIRALVAAALPSLPPKALEHARAGAIVVTDAKPDPAWKVLREDTDRIVYTVGKGQVVAYREEISDPNEFALDVIDLVTHRRRSCRLWNALSSIPRAVIPGRGEMLISVINYGSETNNEIQARVQGRYTRAMLLRPESEPVPLKVSGRGSMTEIFLPGLRRVAAVRFSA
ncbi:MAG: hypothetical protein R2729_18405 [Bryobacteraceae bacterium]